MNQTPAQETKSNEAQASLARTTGSALVALLRKEAAAWNDLADAVKDEIPRKQAHILNQAANEIAKLLASYAAIHWNSAREDFDRATMLAIHAECEHAVPDLKTVLTPNTSICHPATHKDS